MAVSIINFRGRRMTAPMRDAILAGEQKAGRSYAMTQGGFNAGGVAASGFTHDGDAVDWSVRGMTKAEVTKLIESMRWAGIACWFRTTRVAKWGVRAHGFASYHVHGVPNGWGSPSAGARAQAVAYRAGRDGLRGNGPDAGGPGHTAAYRNRRSPQSPIMTPTPVPKEDDMPLTNDDLTKIGAVVSAQLIDYAEKKNRFLDRASADGANRPMSHFVVQGHLQATNAARTAAAILAQSGQDANKIVAGVVAGISGEIREAVVDAMGDIERASADAVADAVLDGLAKRLEA